MNEKIDSGGKKPSIWDRLRKESGLRLQEERKRLGISQTVFAKRAGVSRGSQINYESGEREPDAAYYETIATLGVSLTYIHSGEAIEGFPSFAESIAKIIFEQANTAINPDAMAMLFSLFALNEVYKVGNLAQSFSKDQGNALIQAAFQEGDIFWAAADAAAKNARRLPDQLFVDEGSPQIQAELILETLQRYKETQDDWQENIQNSIRITADRLVDDMLHKLGQVKDRGR